VDDDKAGDESSYSVSPLVTPGGVALSDSEKAEALADNLEAQFQPVTDPSVPAVIEKVDVALRSYLVSPASEPKLTTPRRGSGSHQGSQGQQGSGPKRYPEQGPETSPTASGFPPCLNIQHHPHHPSLPYCVEVRPGDLYTEAG